MLFNSLEFLKFFVLVYTAYWALPALFVGRAWRRVGVAVLLIGACGVYTVVRTPPKADPWAVVVVKVPPKPGEKPPPPTYEFFPNYRQQLLDADAAAAGAISRLYRVPWQCWLAGWVAGLVGVCVIAGGRWNVHAARVWLLLGSSLYFYASWNSWLALLIGVTSALDWVVGLGMEATAVAWRRRLLLGLSLVANLGMLVAFKYCNFFIESLEAGLKAVGGTSNLLLLSVILPVGISFYTFEAINYTVDVYRRKVPAERSLSRFMLFILFFPHLVAGPIVRARDFLPQVARPKRFDWLRTQLGVQFFLMGLFKKLAVADRMALFVDPVFKDPSVYNTSTVWLAVLAYAVQIYCDFSGYTDMALGTAHMLGYKLTQNFNMPYLAVNVSDFWRRWHMSLSGWFRDYVYIPLGGSRAGGWRTDRNLLITFALSGLWHGAAWTFVVWGLLHGLMLVGHRHFREFAVARPTLDGWLRSTAGTALRMALTFLAVAMCWVFFRATSFENALAIFGRMFAVCEGVGPQLSPRSLFYLVGLLALCHLLAARGWWKWLAPRLPAPAMGMGYAVCLTATLVLAPDEGQAFIYFVF